MSPEEIRARTTMRPDGSFSLLVPGDPDLIARREGALAALAEEERLAWESLRQQLPHRSEVDPGHSAARKRWVQDMSLGRRPHRHTAAHLWPMERGVYLRQLAGLFPVLSARLTFLLVTGSPDRGFSVSQWLDLQPQVSGFQQEGEQAAALFIVFVAEGSGSTRGYEAGAAALATGMAYWPQAERAAFSRWAAYPFFPGEAD